MTLSLSKTMQILRQNQSELQRRGVSHIAVFGSVSRGEAKDSSDIDLLVTLNHHSTMGLFEYSDLKLYIQSLFEYPADVANHATLKPLLRDSILNEAINVF